MTQEEHLQETLKAQEIIKAFEVSEAYKLLVEPLKSELESLKYAYECETVEEIATLKGKKEGLQFFLDMLDMYKKKGELAQETAYKIAEKKRKEAMEIDSTDL